MTGSGRTRRLLLVGWDSADWKLIHPLLDKGGLPGVAQLVDSGVSGNLTTLEPQLSPILWTSIATGKMAYHHGVPGFTEVDPLTGHVVPVSAATRKCKTVWEILSERGLKSHVVGWFATQGERDLNGCVVSNMYGHLKNVRPDQGPEAWPDPLPGTYWPPQLAERMNELRVSRHDMDPNEVLRAFVPEGHKVDHQRDTKLDKLSEKLAEAYSVQAAAIHLMETEPEWDFMAIYFRALDEIKHYFMHFHPPKMEGIPQRDFEIYQHVVTSTYRAHDLMLQHLIKLAGPDTAVMLVSDHGFHSDHLRPKFTPRVPAGITVWHRPQGVLAARGPGFQRDQLVHGARLLDITPTVLHYFGLPVGADMEGQVLTTAFEENHGPVQTIPTWENTGKPKSPVTASTLSAAENQALLDQFVALGYIAEVSDDPTQAAADANRENKWNLARAYLFTGKFEGALPLLEDCYEAYPERSDYAQALARCQLRLGLIDESEATLETVLESFGHTGSAHVLRAIIAIEKEDYPEAMKHLETVRAREAEDTQVLLALARTLLALRLFDEAEKIANKVLELDPNHAQACITLARLHLYQGNTDAAVERALDAVGFQYGNPRGHFLLGVALAQEEDWENARTALSNTLQLNPDFLPAYRYLATTLRALGQEKEALETELQLVKQRQKAKAEQGERLQRIRAELATRADERREARRQARERAASAGEHKANADGALEEPKEFILVSGLPRSGTSLMMQMLQAGGQALMTDGAREADEDNPEGYWEWERIKKLPQNPRVLEEAEGKVVKVISALLPHLPPRHAYKIIFMRRPETEVVASQWKMLERQKKAPKSERDHLEKTQANHVIQILDRLRASKRVAVLELDYPSLVTNPKDAVDRLVAFLGESALPSNAQMESVVKPELYRNRNAAKV